MVSKKEWGNALWKFLHVLPGKIIEPNCSPQLIKSMFLYIKNICRLLPCPICSQHATELLSKVNENQCITKKGLKDILYVFHNNVNKKNNVKLYAYENLKEYEKYNIIQVYNNMISKLIHVNGFASMSDNLTRKNLLLNFRKFLIININNNNISL
jgi:hypothetical protein